MSEEKKVKPEPEDLETRENEYPTIENAESVNIYKWLICKLCNKSFVKREDYEAHVKSHEYDDHTYESRKNPLENQQICNICKKKFTAKKNLLKHLRVVHKDLNEAEKLKVKKTICPDVNCLFACRKIRDLRQHIEKHHEIRILKDILQFANEAAFLKWKKNEEDNSVSSFVAFRRKGVLSNGTVKKVLLCHRTGQYSPKGTGKHRLKSRGSCKIGSTCPAAMEVLQGPDGLITVNYYKTHLGHSQDVIHLQLSREDREKLSERIKQGFSLDAILEGVKESIEPGARKTKRIHMLSRKDLYNIMQSSSNKKSKLNFETDVDNFSLKNETNNVGNNVDGNQNIYETSEKNFMVENNSDADRKDGIKESMNSIGIDVNQTCNTDGALHQNEMVTQASASEAINRTTPQVVIVSPNIGYRSVPEVILLQPTEMLTHHIGKPMVTGNPPLILPKGEVRVKEKSKKSDKKSISTVKSPLTLKVEEKIEKLGQVLPKAEFLTPKQYETISGKLDSIINVLNSVNVKTKAKKLIFKHVEVDGEPEKKTMNVEIECLLSNTQNVQQQVYETPLYAYVCNYN